MTVAFFQGRRRRGAAAVGAVAFGLLALSACDKPTPLATVTVGSTTVQTEAACFDEDKALDQAGLEKCLKEQPSDSAKTVKVKPGDKVHVGVDPKIADEGWFVVSSNQQQNNNTKLTYATLDGQRLFAVPSPMGGSTLSKDTVLSVISKNGVWSVKLQLDNG
ncbi:DUF2771 domain-containing protein [Streptomyces sp. UNOC14_S4]|uniref:DUF2771 domain-containing protein n=1 Tax=Streptomyces sp. UNOC14_S4 TaxID=2872340 RepID=UPI001E40B770|nr:DUF2771 domain-containing protein [Streptomyces sp. UNOC14_S4]MCC3770409.1 DUF2771 domain-containing protein [Streptomyces sp. UNOC14_S4]